MVRHHSSPLCEGSVNQTVDEARRPANLMVVSVAQASVCVDQRRECLPDRERSATAVPEKAAAAARLVARIFIYNLIW